MQGRGKQLLQRKKDLEEREYLSIRGRMFSDDMMTTGISLKVDDSCSNQWKGNHDTGLRLLPFYSFKVNLVAA